MYHQKSACTVQYSWHPSYRWARLLLKANIDRFIGVGVRGATFQWNQDHEGQTTETTFAFNNINITVTLEESFLQSSLNISS